MNDEIETSTTKYSLNLIYLLDTSGSMIGERINQLNFAMDEVVQIAEETAIEKEVTLKMRIVEFNTNAKWIFGTTEQGVEHIDWKPLTAGGGTDTAAAIDLARSVMHRTYLGQRNYQPVVILITDGESNEPDKTVKAVESLKASWKSSKNPNKDEIMRIAIGVSGANQAELRNFASIGNIKHDDGTTDENVPFVFNVDDISLLKNVIKTVTVSSIISTLTNKNGGAGNNTPVITDYADDDDDGDWVE